LGKKRVRKNKYRPKGKSTAPFSSRRWRIFLKCTGGVMVVCMLSLGLIFAHDFITQCRYFRIKRIEITGENRVSAETIMRWAHIRHGDNLLAVNIFAARKRLLVHPWITSVEVSRQLPDKISIFIREHRPIAVVDFGKKYILNTDGELFKIWEPADPAHLPRITGLTLSDINLPGTSPSKPLNAVMEVLHLGQQASHLNLSRMVTQIDVDRDIGLTLYGFNDIKAVKLGYNNFKAKYQRLQEIMIHFKNNIHFSLLNMIDLKNLDRIVIKPVRSQPLAASVSKEV
jgi:cell division protein FtsQ